MADKDSHLTQVQLNSDERRRVIEFLETLSLGIHWINAEGVIVWANTSDYEPLGYSSGEYIGHNIADFYADPRVVADLVDRVKSGEEVHERLVQLRAKNGSVREARLTATPIYDDDGNFVHARCYSRDVTAENTAHRYLRLLGDASTLLAGTVNPNELVNGLVGLCTRHVADWCVIELNDGTLAVAHVDPSREAVIGRVWRRPGTAARGEAIYLARITPSTLADAGLGEDQRQLLNDLRVESLMALPLNEGPECIGTLTFASSDPVHNYGPWDLDRANKFAEWTCQALTRMQEHQDTLRAHREMEKAAERLRIIADLGEAMASALTPVEAMREMTRFFAGSMADYCIAYQLNEDGSIERVAATHADAAQQALIDQLAALQKIDLRQDFGVGIVCKTGEPMLQSEIDEVLLQRASRSDDYLRALQKLAPRSSLVLPLEARNRIIGALALATTDLSGDRYTDEDLVFIRELARRAALLIDNARLYVQAQQASTARDRMLSVVSHDLRSPLNTISTASDMLAGELSQQHIEQLGQSISRAAVQMNRLIEDLVEVNRIEQGKLNLDLATVAIPALLEDVLTLHRPVAERHGIELTVDCPDGSTCEADATRMTQALSNLVDNAIKFTPSGGKIHLQSKQLDQDCWFSVSDTGHGIPDDQLPHLFDRYWRAEDPKNRGLGLGLAIVRGVAEAHGGEVTVESSAKGSTFTIRIPARAGAEASRDASSSDLPRILVVEDDDALREEVVEILRNNGYRATGVADGRAALAHLQTRRQPDLILLDLMMPVMDGWEVLETLGADPGMKSIPLVVMSALDTERLHDNASVVGYLHKPFTFDELLKQAAMADASHA